MKNWIYCIALASVLVVVTPALAGWHKNYTGILGNKKIGLTITKGKITSGKELIGEGIIASHYFYHDSLIDIPLKLRDHEGRNIILEEYDDKNNLRGVLGSRPINDGRFPGFP